MQLMATDIGSRLRQAREQRGLSLGDIAATTKIPTMSLAAIERNDFGRLPAGVFRRAFVRTFATEVGLNADELVGEYRARFEPAPAAPPVPPEPAWRERLRAVQRRPVELIAIIGILIGGTLLLQQRQEPGEAPEGREMPAGVEAPAGPESQGDVVHANAAEADSQRSPLRLDLRTTGPCWISAASDGQRTVYRLMQPGESTAVEARRTISLRVGDAGRVEYSINGARGRLLGRNGEAVTIQITPDSLGSLYARPAGHVGVREPGRAGRLVRRRAPTVSTASRP